VAGKMTINNDINDIQLLDALRDKSWIVQWYGNLVAG
jgi:hypothetical protein